MIDRACTLLPQPLSPTTPSTSPFSRSVGNTIDGMDNAIIGVKADVVRSLISSRDCSIRYPFDATHVICYNKSELALDPQLGIERIAQAITEQVEAQHASA